MREFRLLFVLLVAMALGCMQPLRAQSFWQNADSLNRKRLHTLEIGGAAMYVGSIAALSQAWYKSYRESHFHFFNDADEWLQMDKFGHALTSQELGKVGYGTLKWSGLTERKAVWMGGALGMVYLSTVEVFDGFSSGWGSSLSDMTANTFGSALFVSQQLGWKEQRFQLKYSYHPTEYAALRPSQLGSSWSESMLKDYNGQTIWLSVNVRSFVSGESWIPKWLMLSVGQSGAGLLGGKSNPAVNEAGVSLPGCPRYRQFYLSLDVDLYKIHTGVKPLDFIFKTFGFLKIPAPALTYSQPHGFGFKGIYF